MLMMWVKVQNWMRRQEGQALSEYGVVIALVLLACIAGLIAFREEIKTVLSDMTEGMKSR
ncbi:MAG: Flp family type IVb pilin [Bacillota bacterium]